MHNPFHLAFLVKDLLSTRRFYKDILGCSEGRATDSWVDFDFFGNQISAHVAENLAQPQKSSQVDDVKVQIPHFGCLLSRKEFDQLSQRFRTANVEFILEPRTRYKGLPGEQLTMFVKDFSGNIIEFKSFYNPEEIFRG